MCVCFLLTKKWLLWHSLIQRTILDSRFNKYRWLTYIKIIFIFSVQSFTPQKKKGRKCQLWLFAVKRPYKKISIYEHTSISFPPEKQILISFWQNTNTHMYICIYVYISSKDHFAHSEKKGLLIFLPHPYARRTLHDRPVYFGKFWERGVYTRGHISLFHYAENHHA